MVVGGGIDIWDTSDQFHFVYQPLTGDGTIQARVTSIEETDPWAKGDTSGSDSKPATVETGYVLRVPPFIEEGELITIDTRTGEYSTRVKS